MFKLPTELLVPLRSPAICLVDAGYPHVFLPFPAQVPQGERLTGAESGPGSKAYADFEVKGMAQLAKTCALPGEWEGWTCIPRHLRPTPVDCQLIGGVSWFIPLYPIILGVDCQLIGGVSWFIPLYPIILGVDCQLIGVLSWFIPLF